MYNIAEYKCKGVPQKCERLEKINIIFTEVISNKCMKVNIYLAIKIIYFHVTWHGLEI